MIGGTITMGEYNRDEKDKFIFEKPIISNFYDENIINTPSKYKITIQIPAALLEAQIGIDDAYLEFQFINHKITLSDEDILSKTFAKMVNHNEGKFHAVIGLDLLKQYVPELVEDQNLVFKSYLNDSVIYGLAGTLDLEIIEGSIKSPRIIKIEFFQSGEYVKSNEDAFNFTGPNDTSYYKAYEEPDFDGIKN
ncbi:hypothetical protein MJH12_09420 [bacterium]|nr:hypothetical protein [bacterium]